MRFPYPPSSKYLVLEHGVIYRQSDNVIYRRFLNGNLSFVVEYVHLPSNVPEDHYSNTLNTSDILFVERLKSTNEDRPDRLEILEKCELANPENVDCIDEVEDFDEMVFEKVQEIVDTIRQSFGRTLH